MKAFLQTVSIGLFFAGSAYLHAQGVGGPILGFVSDEGGAAVRPLLGVPGASVVGDRLPLGVGVRRLEVSPKQDYALAQRNTDKAVVLFNLNAGTLSARPLGLPGVADLIAISPGGTSAAIYDAGARRVHTVSGLPGNPAPTRTFDLSRSTGRVAGLSVTDDGTLALLRSDKADGGTEFSVTGDSVSWGVPIESGAVVFAPGGRDVIVADNLTKSVFLVTDIGGSYARRPLFILADETDAFTVAAMSVDGKRVVTTTQSGAVAVMELATGQVAWLSCPCRPTMLEPLKGTSLFRLTGVSATEPMISLDASSAEARFVLTLPNTTQ